MPHTFNNHCGTSQLWILLISVHGIGILFFFWFLKKRSEFRMKSTEFLILQLPKPLTKFVTGGGFFVMVVCPCLEPSPPLCPISVFRCSSSIFFLKISMKLPSLAKALPPGSGVWLVAAELLHRETGLSQLESPLLSPLVWDLTCFRFESIIDFTVKSLSSTKLWIF